MTLPLHPYSLDRIAQRMRPVTHAMSDTVFFRFDKEGNLCTSDDVRDSISWLALSISEVKHADDETKIAELEASVKAAAQESLDNIALLEQKNPQGYANLDKIKRALHDCMERPSYILEQVREMPSDHWHGANGAKTRKDFYNTIYSMPAWMQVLMLEDDDTEYKLKPNFRLPIFNDPLMYAWFVSLPVAGLASLALGPIFQTPNLVVPWMQSAILAVATYAVSGVHSQRVMNFLAPIHPEKPHDGSDINLALENGEIREAVTSPPNADHFQEIRKHVFESNLDSSILHSSFRYAVETLEYSDSASERWVANEISLLENPASYVATMMLVRYTQEYMQRNRWEEHSPISNILRAIRQTDKKEAAAIERDIKEAITQDFPTLAPAFFRHILPKLQAKAEGLYTAPSQIKAA